MEMGEKRVKGNKFVPVYSLTGRMNERDFRTAPGFDNEQREKGVEGDHNQSVQSPAPCGILLIHYNDDNQRNNTTWLLSHKVTES